MPLFLGMIHPSQGSSIYEPRAGFLHQAKLKARRIWEISSMVSVCPWPLMCPGFLFERRYGLGLMLRRDLDHNCIFCFSFVWKEVYNGFRLVLMVFYKTYQWFWWFSWSPSGLDRVCREFHRWFSWRISTLTPWNSMNLRTRKNRKTTIFLVI